MTDRNITEAIKELERQIGETGREEQINATRQLRRVIDHVTPQRGSDGYQFDADDDLMFDNMPV